MSLRLVDIYLPSDYETLPGIEDENVTLDHWQVDLKDGRSLIRVLVESEHTEGTLDWINNTMEITGDARVVVSSVDAVIPRPDMSEEEELSDEEEKQTESRSVTRISREELRQDLDEAIGGVRTYHILVALSTVVAAGGMLRDSVPIVIGAMVIAPLIGPNIALSFATTIGDREFFWRSFRVNFVGLLVGLLLSIIVGVFFIVDPTVPEIGNRLMVHWSDIILALAAGAAGSLAFTRGVSTALIGVMVAVALLPPLVAMGLMLGEMHWYAAYGASLLVLTNVTCINIAAVATFLLQGIRPQDWFKVEQAREHTRYALLMWFLMLALLMLAMWLAGEPAILAE